MAYNCFVVIWHIVLIEVAVVLVAIKIAVGIGLLENAVTGVFFIPDDVANAGRGQRPLSWLEPVPGLAPWR